MRPAISLHTVAILGGGFGGVRAALDLDRLLPPEYSIVLIDKKTEHAPAWMLYETATAFMDGVGRHQMEEVMNASSVPYAEIFTHTRVRVLRGIVDDVLLDAGAVSVKNELGTLLEVVRFSYLVVALGSETNYYTIAGLSERAYGLKSIGDAINIRNTIEELFISRRYDEMIHISIGGGGFSGIELAGELAMYVRALARKYQRSESRAKISIIEAGPCILGGAKPWVSRAVLHRLESLHIAVYTETPIEAFDGKLITLKGDRQMPTDLLVWTAGIKPNPIVSRMSGVPLEKNCLMVDDHLRVGGRPEIYAVGDVVYCFDSVRNCPIPPTAQRALDHADIVARNIAHDIAGLPLDVYHPQDPIFVVPVGGKYAVMDLFGLHFVGIWGWMMKMLVGLKYNLSILPPRVAISRSLSALRVFMRNDS